MVSLALLGAGRIGALHAEAIAGLRGAWLTAVSDPDADASGRIAERHGCRLASVEEIEADEAIDGVLICTPTDTHASLIDRFARAGKAIFCEKPVDLELARVRECLSVVRETGGRLMIGFNRRFDPHFEALRHAIEDGRIGSVEQIVIASRDPAPPPLGYIKNSGGIFCDMTIHDFDMARHLLGEEPVTVLASASAIIDPQIGQIGDFDTASLILTTASGRQCSISNSRRAAYGYDQRIEVHGSLGSVAAMNQRPADIEVATADGYLRPPLHNFFMTRYLAAYGREIAAFASMIAEGGQPSPDGEDGLRSLVLALAALRSVREARAVSIEEFED